MVVHLFVCLIVSFVWYRPYLMGYTRAACIEQWWMGKEREGHWLSLWTQKQTKWWDPHKILFAEKGQDYIQISHGHNCWASLKNSTELMRLHSQALSAGSRLPKTSKSFIISGITLENKSMYLLVFEATKFISNSINLLLKILKF